MGGVSSFPGFVVTEFADLCEIRRPGVCLTEAVLEVGHSAAADLDSTQLAGLQECPDERFADVQFIGYVLDAQESACRRHAPCHGNALGLGRRGSQPTNFTGLLYPCQAGHFVCECERASSVLTGIFGGESWGVMCYYGGVDLITGVYYFVSINGTAGGNVDGLFAYFPNGTITLLYITSPDARILIDTAHGIL